MNPLKALQRNQNQREDTSTLIERSGLFDAQFYAEKYADVASSRLSAVEHFCLLGVYDGRNPHALFDTNYYVTKHAEVGSWGLNPLEHYIKHGAAAGLDPHPLFDTAFYLQQVPANSDAQQNPLLHFLSHGAARGLDPHPRFDTSFYVENAPDVLQIGLNPLVHYLLHGAAQGKAPHPLFSTNFYLQQYPDVQESGINPLMHYVQYGIHEERIPRNLFLEGAGEAINSHYASLCEIEPLLPSPDSLQKLRLRKSVRSTLAGVVYFKLADALDQPFDHLVMLGNLGDGRSNSNSSRWQDLIKSLVTKYSANSLLVLAADQSSFASLEAIGKQLPPGVRFISLDCGGTLHPPNCRHGDHAARELTVLDRMTIVTRLILQAEPTTIFNCSSQICSIVAAECRSQLSGITRIVDDSLLQVDWSDSSMNRSSAAVPTVSDTKVVAENSTTFNISLIINCHSEGDLLSRTIAAASLSADQARKSGLTVEWLFVLDRPDEATRQCLRRHIPADARLIETDLGDPGLARNAGVTESRGEFVAFMDGDDLYSPNWLGAAYNYARTITNKSVIMHPFGTICFGESELINLFYGSDDPYFSPTALIVDTSWQSNSFARRSIYLSHPYRASDTQKGFGFEDWLWNCDTIAAGVKHKLVPNTFFCYRVKPSANSRNAKAHSCIIAKSRLFDLRFEM